MTLQDELFLVEQAKAGSQAAFTELYNLTANRVRHVGHRILRDPDKIDDFLQDVFLRCFINLDKFRGDARFSTWIVRIAHNEALTQLRKAKGCYHGEACLCQNFCVNDDGSELRWDPPAEEPDKDEKLYVEQAMQRLGRFYPKSQEILLLRYFEGLTDEEIAEQIGVTLPAVSARVFKARKRLREKLLVSPA